MSSGASGHLRVLAGGLGSSVQDAGRPGLRHQGIASSGWLDGLLAACANALLGNAADAACVELRGPGLLLQVDDGPVAVALAVLAHPLDLGDGAGPAASGLAVGQTPGQAPARAAPTPRRPAARIRRADGRTEDLPAHTSATLQPGDQLQVAEPARGGAAYLALSGGLQVAPQLGSRATQAGARLGGVQGRALAAGDALPCARLVAPPATERHADAFSHPSGPLRAMPGPQAEAFTPAALAQFFTATWRATHAQDRMGLRLGGPLLAHVDAAAADLVSEGVVAGSVQVPSNGQPIVLLADGQTVGGYPKIATVVSADLPRLAHAPPGTPLRFVAVDRAQALAARAAARTRWQTWAATIRPMPAAGPDAAALWEANLVSGVVDALGAADVP